MSHDGTYATFFFSESIDNPLLLSEPWLEFLVKRAGEQEKIESILLVAAYFSSVKTERYTLD